MNIYNTMLIAEGRFEELKPQITAFVYECYNHYNEVIKEYIAFPITSNEAYL